jgi:hypothetical protein
MINDLINLLFDLLNNSVSTAGVISNRIRREDYLTTVIMKQGDVAAYLKADCYHGICPESLSKVRKFCQVFEHKSK